MLVCSHVYPSLRETGRRRVQSSQLQSSIPAGQRRQHLLCVRILVGYLRVPRRLTRFASFNDIFRLNVG